MELRLPRIPLMLILVVTARAQSDQPPAVTVPPLGVMRKAVLEDGRPYEVAVGAVPTTILMPAPIEAFEGNNITTTANTAAALFLQHEAGTRFFSVKALLPGTADLNVIVSGKVYSFRFYFSQNPTRTLDIEPERTGRIGSDAVRVTPRRLYDLLQDAKTYFVLKEQHPELQRQMEVAAPGKVLIYPGYRVVLDQVFRFAADDTLIFRVIFINDTAEILHYLPGEIRLRIGRNLYSPSFAQVPRFVPPREPARLSWEISPEVTELELSGPGGKMASLLGQAGASLPILGNYGVRAGGHGKADSVHFAVKYPPAAGDPDPLVVAKGHREFGIRRLELQQPRPGENFGYVAFTGTADGQKANLSIKNDFALIVPMHADP